MDSAPSSTPSTPSSPESVDFAQLEIAPEVLRAVTELGYETPTPVQAQCIPPLLAGRDVLGQAHTGTGKTAAFALPLLSRIDLERLNPQVLVLTPTRELALQVAEAFQSYARHLPGFHVLPLYGGQGMAMQLRQLRRGAHIIVGTPGRVMDHLRRGALALDGLHTLVLDEADEMLNMGFVEDIEWIFDQAPKERQVALFSATMAGTIKRVAQRHLRDPVEIKVAAKTATVSTIAQRHIVVTGAHKLDALTRILEAEPFDAMLVFVRTRTATVELAQKLEAHGFAAEGLSGDMSQEQRERTVQRLKNQKLDIVVATDVAARGLDVERITHVVNYDIPNDPEAYVHRIGRTGRAGREGKALLFVQPRERHLLRIIERTTRQTIPSMTLPSANDISERRIDEFMNKIRETVAEQDLDYYYRLVSRVEKELEMEIMDIAAALTYMAQGARPFIVEEPKAPPPRPERRERRERTPGEGRGRRRDDIPRLRYRLAVGHKHGVTPREIVGAITNEAGLEGSYIGYIDIHDDYSTVELPEGMPGEIEQHLRKTVVCGRPLKLSLLPEREDRGGRYRDDRGPGRGKPHGKKGFGKRPPRPRN